MLYYEEARQEHEVHFDSMCPYFDYSHQDFLVQQQNLLHLHNLHNLPDVAADIVQHNYQTKMMMNRRSVEFDYSL